MTKHIENGLQKGVVLAAALCCSLHDQPGIAMDILRELMIDRAFAIKLGCYEGDILVLDEYDGWPTIV